MRGAELKAELQRFQCAHGLKWMDHQSVGNSTESSFSLYSPEDPAPTYRYAYGRIWDQAGPLVLWIMLNPGTGDTEQRRRPTAERCRVWSERLGAGGMVFGNLFALRSKTPRDLRELAEPVGPYNDEVLKLLSLISSRTIVAWGNGGRLLERANEVCKRLQDPECLGVTSSGQPRHPLYVATNARLSRWFAPGRNPSI